MEKDLISIIVPVYNVEKYLEKCIESIINQTYTNIEIILVDDGSTDNSGKICDFYKEKDERIKVIHKPNGGLSDARNKGIEIAKGKYIGFVDSDDYIENDMYETLYNLAIENNAEISIVSYTEIYNGKIIGQRKSHQTTIFNKIEGIKQLLIDEKIQSFAWNKLYKKELFNDIKFPLKKRFEDLTTTLYVFENANKIALKETPKYYYIRRDDSIVGIKNRDYSAYLDKLELLWDKYWTFKDKYPELEIFNKYNFVVNMIDIYNIIAISNLKELEAEFEKKYTLFETLINESGKDIIDKLSNYNKAIIYMMLVDRQTSKEAVKIFVNTCEEKRLNGGLVNK